MGGARRTHTGGGTNTNALSVANTEKQIHYKKQALKGLYFLKDVKEFR
jgi:hypothetical protein